MTERSPTTRFFGGLLIAAGLMMMVLCGGCGVVFLVSFLVETLKSPNREDLSFVLMPIFLGGVPAGLGLGLFIAGRSLRRPPD